MSGVGVRSCPILLARKYSFVGYAVEIGRIEHDYVLWTRIPIKANEAPVCSHPLNGSHLPVISNPRHVNANALPNLYVFQFHRISPLYPQRLAATTLFPA